MMLDSYSESKRNDWPHAAARNSLGISGHVFEGLSAPGEPSPAFFGNSKNLASASCRSTQLIQAKLRNEERYWEKDLRAVQYTDTSICQEVFDF